MRLSAARPRRQNSHRADADKRCEPYLKWIRTRRCYLTGRFHHACSGKVRACHVGHAGDKGIGTKVSDKHVIPMCDGAHEEQHRIGWSSFEALHRFNAVQVAGALWSSWIKDTTMGRIWQQRRAEGL